MNDTKMNGAPPLDHLQFSNVAEAGHVAKLYCPIAPSPLPLWTLTFDCQRGRPPSGRRSSHAGGESVGVRGTTVLPAQPIPAAEEENGGLSAV